MFESKLMKKFDLSGKTALITGSAGLLGIQHAEALLSAGARCVLVDNDQKKLVNATNSLKLLNTSKYVIPEVVDITKKAEVVELNERLVKTGYRVDILINNAAINPKMSGIDELHENSRFEHFALDQWQKEIEVGLTGAFICSQIFGYTMATESGGNILNIASDLAIVAPDQRIYRQPGLEDEQQPVKPVTYSIIKHALVGLTKYLATYWADKNVRVNAICPGGIFTDQSDDFVQRLTNLIPMGRMANKDEYQAAVLFLVSEASSYMTGAVLTVDGGRTCW